MSNIVNIDNYKNAEPIDFELSEDEIQRVKVALTEHIDDASISDDTSADLMKGRIVDGIRYVIVRFTLNNLGCVISLYQEMNNGAFEVVWEPSKELFKAVDLVSACDGFDVLNVFCRAPTGQG